MQKNPQKIHNRRHMFTAALRYAGAGLLAVGGAAAVAKRKRLLYDGKCINRNICRDCPIFARCGLPLALSSRQAQSRKNNDPQE
ncbi:MAG: hypothetical protein J7M40_03820 [Planctomycetes bacterium]|nr:hypothetical protein [Planctomycetota bacterium]